MKDLKKQFKLIADTLQNLSQQFEALSETDEAKEVPKEKAAKKVAKKKTAVKKAAKKKTAVKKAAGKKAAVKVSAKKAPKKAAKKPTTAGKSAKTPPVLETVLSIIEKGRKGTSIAKLRDKTDFEARQISNALYKLTKKGLVTQSSRGIYVKKK